ncbi:MAG: iron-sulfur cluster assembly scaffold protein [Gammaproteobacteria bacterium]
MPDPLVYSPEVERRFEAPPRQGELFGAPTDRLAGSAGDTRLGARVSFEARVRSGRVVECRFRAYGCPHVIAAASWVAEHAEGRAVGEPDWPDAHELARRLEAPAHKLGSLLVVEDAYRAMVADTGGRPGQ